MMTVLNTPTHTIEVHGDPSDPMVKKPSIERKWRDSELARTDLLMAVSDYPQELKDKLAVYREDLRAYPQKDGFPNVDRPVIG